MSALFHKYIHHYKANVCPPMRLLKYFVYKSMMTSYRLYNILYINRWLQHQGSFSMRFLTRMSINGYPMPLMRCVRYFMYKSMITRRMVVSIRFLKHFVYKSLGTQYPNAISGVAYNSVVAKRMIVPNMFSAIFRIHIDG